MRLSRKSLQGKLLQLQERVTEETWVTRTWLVDWLMRDPGKEPMELLDWVPPG